MVLMQELFKEIEQIKQVYLTTNWEGSLNITLMILRNTYNKIEWGTIVMTSKCHWCQNTFSPRLTGGSPQKFCNKDCKRMFEKSIRQWGYDAHVKHTDKIIKLQSMHSLHANKDKS